MDSAALETAVDDGQVSLKRRFGGGKVNFFWNIYSAALLHVREQQNKKRGKNIRVRPILIYNMGEKRELLILFLRISVARPMCGQRQELFP